MNQTKPKPEPKPKIKAGILAFLLASVLCIPQPLSSYGETVTEEVEFPYEDSKTDQNSILTGNVKVELISVALPAGGFDFEIDTEKEFSLDNPGNQIRDAALPITNYSMVTVQVEISEVDDMKDTDVIFQPPFTDQIKQSFQLVDQISRVGPNGTGTAILVLGVSGATYATPQAFEQNAMIPGRKTSIFITEIPAQGTRYLSLYGKAAPDFFGEYSFTVRPTIKISAAR